MRLFISWLSINRSKFTISCLLSSDDCASYSKLFAFTSVCQIHCACTLVVRLFMLNISIMYSKQPNCKCQCHVIVNVVNLFQALALTRKVMDTLVLRTVLGQEKPNILNLIRCNYSRIFTQKTLYFDLKNSISMSFHPNWRILENAQVFRLQWSKAWMVEENKYLW